MKGGGGLFCSTFPAVPVFLPDHDQYVGLKHVVQNKNEHKKFAFCVCVDHITSQTNGLCTEGLPYSVFF